MTFLLNLNVNYTLYILSFNWLSSSMKTDRFKYSIYNGKYQLETFIYAYYLNQTQNNQHKENYSNNCLELKPIKQG